jgi:threonyl-tRNA synthetase
VMLHRVILGSMDRFLGILIEHYAGAFPVGFAPVQALIVTITDEHFEFGKNVLAQLKSGGIRARGDFRNEKLGLKVREAQIEKVPYTLIIGQAEVAGGTVTPRLLSGKNLESMKIAEFIEHVKKESSVFWRG